MSQKRDEIADLKARLLQCEREGAEREEFLQGLIKSLAESRKRADELESTVWHLRDVIKGKAMGIRDKMLIVHDLVFEMEMIQDGVRSREYDLRRLKEENKELEIQNNALRESMTYNERVRAVDLAKKVRCPKGKK